MSKTNIEDGGKLFKSSFLEAMTKTHIVFPLAIFYGSGIFVPIWGVMSFGNEILTSVIIFIAAILAFTLFEYVVHRYFYHMAETSATRARLTYIFHGIHHDHPRDKKRLALPPLLSAIVSALFILIFWLIMGDYGLAFGGGFLVGYASYLMVHYAVHVFKPPKNFLKVIWKHHNIHHYVDNTAAFGVSSPLWDHIFRTLPKDPVKH